MRRTLLIIHILLTLLFIADMILWFGYSISLNGYWPDRILFWLWFFSGVIVIGLYYKTILAKIYGILWIALIILAMIPMLIPFVTFLGIITGKDRMLYHKYDEMTRSEVVVSGMIYVFSITEKGKLLEKEVVSFPVDGDFKIDEEFLHINDFDKMELLDYSAEKVRIKLFKADEEVVFEKELKN